MSSIVHGANKKCSLDSTSMVRAFQDGEGVWFDPNSGEDIIAGTCKNVIGPKKERQAAAPQQLTPGAQPPAPRVASAPQPVVVGDERVIIFHLFKPEGEALRLKRGESGSNSRDIGDKVRRAAATGHASYVDQCYPFGIEFFSIGSSETTLLLNGNPLRPVEQKGAMVRYEFAACARSELKVPPGFITTGTWVEIPPKFTADYYYPLNTWKSKPGELERVFRVQGSPQDGLFVVNKGTKPIS